MGPEMQRKPGFPVVNCSIKMPDNLPVETSEDDGEQQQRRQQLINFGHAQWGFNNWNWAVTKQELDFVDQSNGKYCAGVVAFVSITVKNIDIHRENIGYATSVANNKGFAIYKSRKVSVTNALRETLLSFGGTVATELAELLETTRDTTLEKQDGENNQNIANLTNLANTNLANSIASATTNIVNTNLANTNIVNPPPNHTKSLLEGPAIVNTLGNANHTKALFEGPPLVKNLGKNSVDGAVNPPPVKNAAPVARAHPMPPRVPANPRPQPPPAQPVHPRPNSNVSFVLQPVMGSVVPPMYAPPRLAAPQIPPVYQNYYECGPWHFYEPHGNVNLNFNIPPKNLVVNSQAGSVECKNQCRARDLQYGPQQNRGCWIKPTIFYDGFWTEQKVKKWVAEQVEKQFPDEQKTPSPGKPDVK